MSGALTRVVLLLALTIGALTSCQISGSGRDVEGAEVRDPDYIFLTNNIDEHPNIAVVCVNGVGFATTTRDYGSAITRIPEWDGLCEEHLGEGPITDPADPDEFHPTP